MNMPDMRMALAVVASVLVLGMCATVDLPASDIQAPEPVNRVLIPHGLLADEDREKLQAALDDWRAKVLMVTDWAIDKAQSDAIETERAHFEPLVAGLEAQIAVLEKELEVVQQEAERAEAERWRGRLDYAEAENDKLRRSKLVDGLVFTLGSAGAGLLAGTLMNQCK